MAAGAVSVKNTSNDGRGCNIFDGADDSVNTVHCPELLGANLLNGFTISAWINPKSAGETNGYIFSKATGGNGQGGFFFALASSARFFLRLNGGDIKTSASLAITYGKWQHVLATVSSAQLINYYIDGVQSGIVNQDLGKPISEITTNIIQTIGNRSNGTDRSFDGGIKDIKVWNKVLDSTEIIKNASETNTADKQIIYFPLGGNYVNKGSVEVTATNSGSVVGIMDGEIGTALKGQRVTANDKFLIYKGAGGQVGSIAIEE